MFFLRSNFVQIRFILNDLPVDSACYEQSFRDHNCVMLRAIDVVVDFAHRRICDS
jgi:hypothetical protein